MGWKPEHQVQQEVSACIKETVTPQHTACLDEIERDYQQCKDNTAPNMR